MSFKDPWGCAACKKKFVSLTLFETHRVGKFTDEHPRYGRSCLSDKDMQDRGYNLYEGVWTTATPEEAKKQAEGRSKNARSTLMGKARSSPRASGVPT